MKNENRVNCKTSQSSLSGEAGGGCFCSVIFNLAGIFMWILQGHFGCEHSLVFFPSLVFSVSVSQSRTSDARMQRAYRWACALTETWVSGVLGDVAMERDLNGSLMSYRLGSNQHSCSPDSAATPPKSQANILTDSAAGTGPFHISPRNHLSSLMCSRHSDRAASSAPHFPCPLLFPI